MCPALFELKPERSGFKINFTLLYIQLFLFSGQNTMKVMLHLHEKSKSSHFFEEGETIRHIISSKFGIKDGIKPSPLT
jgi:hypothetical protein